MTETGKLALLGAVAALLLVVWLVTSTPSAGHGVTIAMCPPAVVSSSVAVTCHCAPTSDEPDAFPQLPPSSFVDARGDRVRP